jgi:hypothetical protein
LLLLLDQESPLPNSRAASEKNARCEEPIHAEYQFLGTLDIFLPGRITARRDFPDSLSPH